MAVKLAAALTDDLSHSSLHRAATAISQVPSINPQWLDKNHWIKIILFITKRHQKCYQIATGCKRCDGISSNKSSIFKS